MTRPKAKEGADGKEGALEATKQNEDVTTENFI